MAEIVPDRRTFLIGSGGALLGAALAGCSSSSGSTAASTSSAAAAAPTSATAAAPTSATAAAPTSATAPTSAATSAPAATASVGAPPSGTAAGPLKGGTYVTNSDDVTSTWEIPLWNSTHSGFQLKLVTSNTNTYTATFPQLVDSSDAPNVAGFFIDGGVYTDLAKAGKFVELSDVWEKGGLNTAIPGLVKEIYHNFTPDKKVYAVPTNASTYGMFFYSRKALQKAGVAEPVNNQFKDVAEFEAAIAAGKKVGLDGIALGGKDGYPISHLQDGVLSSFMTPDEVKDVLNIDYTGDKWLTPVQTLVDWGKAGYYSKGFLGQDAPAAKTYFAQGKSLFCMAINVWLPDLIKAGMTQDDLGWVLVPQVGPLPSKISFYSGGGLVVPNKAPGGPDFAQAKEFVLWASSPAIALANAKKSQAFQGRTDVPGLVGALGPVVSSMITYSQKAGAVQQGWDDPAPTDMITYDRKQLQAVLAGSQSVKSFGAALQALATAHKKSGK